MARVKIFYLASLLGTADVVTDDHVVVRARLLLLYVIQTHVVLQIVVRFSTVSSCPTWWMSLYRIRNAGVSIFSILILRSYA